MSPSSPSKGVTSYENYPVLINTGLTLSPSDTGASDGLDIQILEYSPQTINTKFQSSSSDTDSNGQSAGSSLSSTVGSSTSQTNSYGASVSLGTAGYSVSANYDHSTTATNEHSFTGTDESSQSRNQESSSSASMSLKDWGAYAMFNPRTKEMSWTFGQEYPWDAIECRTTDGLTYNNQTRITIPKAMSARLWDGIALYPPSHLSMYGVNFIMRALWLVTITDPTLDEITVSHVINYFSGSHNYPSWGGYPGLDVFMDPLPTVLQGDTPLSATVDLPLLALDPVGLQGKGAVIGFIPNKFTVSPAAVGSQTPPSAFKIAATSNNLLIKDTTAYPAAPASGDAGFGFTAGETALTAAFTEKDTSLSMTLYFKVTDTVSDYTLFMKHWTTRPAEGTSKSTGVVLTFIVNGDKANPITKYLDALEAEGGENNLTRIALRNLDFSTIDYHDYLQLGLNTVSITIQPIDLQNAANCGYAIRALSVEKD
ncbi:hypothetical protein [Corallococcus sp. CA054B]|uniref:hypothetical protein n=1 Tax=Corallococcus sp. CA054B TaxID=2316734 RepID=UPI0018F2D862|nr:hypothetical protein [Corallococcus sp. CA054B]